MPSIRLRPIRTSDAELSFRWVNDPDVALHLGLVQASSSVEQERAWIARARLNPSQLRVFIIEDEEGRPLGTGTLRDIDSPERAAYLGVMIGEKNRWGGGYGTEATRRLLEVAFGELDLREVRLHCHLDNERALRCFEKAGFTRGKDRTLSPGRSSREVMMVITREQWESGGCAG